MALQIGLEFRSIYLNRLQIDGNLFYGFWGTNGKFMKYFSFKVLRSIFYETKQNTNSSCLVFFPFAVSFIQIKLWPTECTGSGNFCSCDFLEHFPNDYWFCHLGNMVSIFFGTIYCFRPGYMRLDQQRKCIKSF